jgi:hypothetical protein
VALLAEARGQAEQREHVPGRAGRHHQDPHRRLP